VTVEHILSAKGHDVFTIEPQCTLADAARLLSERRIGALSERDIVRALAAHGTAALEQPVSRCMTTDVVTCRARASITDVMEVMTNGKFRHVPVVENDRLAGIVSIGDIVKQRLAEIETEQQALKEYIATA
jgi:CBS domain-containing protein